MPAVHHCICLQHLVSSNSAKRKNRKQNYSELFPIWIRLRIMRCKIPDDTGRLKRATDRSLNTMNNQPNVLAFIDELNDISCCCCSKLPFVAILVFKMHYLLLLNNRSYFIITCAFAPPFHWMRTNMKQRNTHES